MTSQSALSTNVSISWRLDVVFMPRDESNRPALSRRRHMFLISVRASPGSALFELDMHRIGCEPLRFAKERVKALQPPYVSGVTAWSVTRYYRRGRTPLDESELELRCFGRASANSSRRVRRGRLIWRSDISIPIRSHCLPNALGQGRKLFETTRAADQIAGGPPEIVAPKLIYSGMIRKKRSLRC